MRDEFGLPITAMTGPATDNDVGQSYIRKTLGLPAYNARRNAEGLVAAARAGYERWMAGSPVPAAVGS
jgi:hypothetical protein